VADRYGGRVQPALRVQGFPGDLRTSGPREEGGEPEGNRALPSAHVWSPERDREGGHAPDATRNTVGVAVHSLKKRKRRKKKSR